MAEFSHIAAVASQKVTRPGVTGAPAEDTVAVNATAVPEVTVVTGRPPTVTASVVAVAAAVDWETV
jgi:hypothetical protein